MNTDGCSIDVRTTPGGGTLVTVVGEVDASNCAVLRDVLDGLATGEAAPDAHLDLSGLGFVDSSGLRVLLVGQLALQQRGGSLRIVDASPAVDRLLDVTGLRAQLR